MSYWFLVSPPGSVSMSLVLECLDIVAVPLSTGQYAELTYWNGFMEEKKGVENGVDSQIDDLRRQECSTME